MVMSKFAFVAGACLAGLLSLASPAHAMPLEVQPEPATLSFVETGCAYCESYAEPAAEAVVASTWAPRTGYDLRPAAQIEITVAPESGCAYCGDYHAEAGTPVVASTWTPASGYTPVRTAQAGWRIW